MQVRVIHTTPDAEKHIGYCARVSSPNQDNPDYAKLLAYCIKHQHWSVFEMAGMCVEITTSRAVSAQILRHRSFSFQEFSQRYSEVTEFETYEARKQDTKNRQNSTDTLDNITKTWYRNALSMNQKRSRALYNHAISQGVAKECARMLLPMNTQTKLYMHGSLRSWIHYINLRTEVGTQLEHREIAEICKQLFKSQFPMISKALGW